MMCSEQRDEASTHIQNEYDEPESDAMKKDDAFLLSLIFKTVEIISLCPRHQYN